MNKILTAMKMGASLLALSSTGALAQELNVLAWCDHTDPALLDPFTEQTGIKVNVRDYEGTGAGLALLEQSRPGDWDVWVLDSPAIPEVVRLNKLASLDPADYPMADIPEKVQNAGVHMIDGKWYGMPEKYGYHGFAFNKEIVNEGEISNLKGILASRFKGRVAVYNYYRPIMGMIAVGLGIDPAKFDEKDLESVKAFLNEVKPNVAIVSDIVTSQTALATGDADVLLGGGEYAIATILPEHPNLDWTVPSEGSVRYEQSIAILADSEKKDDAKKFVQYILSPEGQARLATSSCFWGMPANRQATLTEEQKTALRWDKQDEYLARTTSYIAPTGDLAAKAEAAWADFMQ
ncbi:PotD/PotF family extracellular solute-binding protein [Sinorhizobium meliloti]|uniref:ABC transporter substrate-binding protein n=1 Tax=Rhizobium meliloti TaxID=382 RepID=UPI003D64F08C